MKKTVSFLALFLVVSILFSGVSAYYHTDRSPDWNDGYEEGYNKGYDSGESWGYEDGKSDGYSEGYTDGYDQGKNIAANKGEKESRALKEELQGANSQLRIYKNATVGLGFLSAALVLGAAGYYFFVIKRKKLGFFKAETKAAETSPSVTNPAPHIKPSSSNSAKPARIVRARAVKKAPVPAASLTRSSVSAATPDRETGLDTISAVTAEPSKRPANPKESTPILSQDEYFEQHIKSSGMKCGWMKVLRSSLWFWMLVPLIIVSGIWSYLIDVCPVLPALEPNEGLYAGHEFLRIIQGVVNLFCIFTLPSKLKRLDSAFLGRGLSFIIFNVFVTLINAAILGSIIGGVAAVGLIFPIFYYTLFIIYFYRRKSLFE